jgi:predicted ArsR family transcriptional regulator
VLAAITHEPQEANQIAEKVGRVRQIVNAALATLTAQGKVLAGYGKGRSGRRMRMFLLPPETKR